ncbi:MAG: hypothetical protein VKJ02_12440 [Snowella sp.]|nr:hypothetical protein [Snowella sp.]
MPINIVKIKKSQSVDSTNPSESTTSEPIAEQATESKAKKTTKSKKKVKETETPAPIESSDTQPVEVAAPVAAIAEQATESKAKKTTKSKKKVKETEISAPIESPETQPVEVEPSVTQEEVTAEVQPKASNKKQKKAKTANKAAEPSEQESTSTEPTEPEVFFQAIGALHGKLIKRNSRYSLQVGEHTFPLNLSGKYLMGKVAKLEPDQEVYLKVYPQWLSSFANQEVIKKLSFRVIGCSTLSPAPFQVNQFILRGVWQKSPKTGEPQLTIYRNKSRGPWDDCQPLHVPLIWENAPIEPFFYDATLEKKDWPKRYFCQLETILDLETQTFTVTGQLEEPTTQIPFYVKPSKPSTELQPTEQKGKQEKKISHPKKTQSTEQKDSQDHSTSQSQESQSVEQKDQQNKKTSRSKKSQTKAEKDESNSSPKEP